MPGIMNRFRRRSLCILLAAAAVLLPGCAQLPPLDGRPSSQAFTDTADTRLGRAVAPLVQANPGKSGIIALTDDHGAFAVRVLLAEAAERSLDVQYYIWQHDLSGTLLFEALHRAADRGVRVRLLLDDNNARGLDPLLAALDAHPNIEVRLFNPFLHRRWRALGYLTDFSRLNRRMHNKSFTADSQVTIVGGRNIGDEYFGAGDFSFADLDVLAIGPVVRDVATDFDRYWSSGSAYPALDILPATDPAGLAELDASASLIERDAAAAAYMQALRETPFVQDLLAGRLQFEWAVTRMISDDPAKGLGQADEETLLPWHLAEVLGAPRQELLLVSPYFVPTAAGVEALAALADRGVAVSVLTNALEATDVAVVHAGYAKRRKALLEAGIRLYEMKREIAAPRIRDHGLAGSSASSLHAKTFAVDRERVFVGSFNFDPRSARLNTEMGFVIDSPALAVAMATAFADIIPELAYEVRLSDSGRLQWIDRRAGQATVLEHEPGTRFWQRAAVRIIGWLPIEWLL